MNYGDFLRRARLDAGLTQTELAKRMGVTPQYISQYERNNRMPKTETVVKFAKALGISENMLLFPFLEPESYDALKNGEEGLAAYFEGLSEEEFKINYAKRQRLHKRLILDESTWILNEQALDKLITYSKDLAANPENCLEEED